jgi:hypothetical protein
MPEQRATVPLLYVKNRGEQTTKVELKLTTASDQTIVRFTGGCGYMSPQDAQGMYDLLTKAFYGYAGAILFGGTRMLSSKDSCTIVPGITEVPPLIKKECPGCVLLGVVPKTRDLEISHLGLIISRQEDYLTIVHPDQDQCLIVQQTTDEGVDWEAEFTECLRIIQDLRDMAGWQSLLVSYNGGEVTRKEIIATAERGWSVLLIADSGRVTEEFSRNLSFLSRYPNVKVAEKNSWAIHNSLAELNIVKSSKCEIVKFGGKANG